MEFKASYHQERLWFIDQSEAGVLYDPSPTYYNIPLICKLKGNIDFSILEKSIKAVFDRHEALRTKILTKDSQPVQMIVPETDFKLEHLDLTGYQGDVAGEALKFAQRPFCLETEFLARAQLIQIAAAEFVLVISIHHIITDRCSLKIMAREIFTYYDALLSGETPLLAELSAHYADFSQWQYGLTDEAWEPLLLYWRRKLKGKLQPLQFPLDKPRAPIHIFHEGTRQFAIEPDICAKIASFCRLHKTTPYLLLLAVFKTLLYRYAGHEEIVVGVGVENRDQPGLEQTVGPLANLLVTRDWLDGKAGFLKVLEDLEKTVNEAQKYKNLPFDRLVQELNPPKDTSRSVFFDVLFQYDEQPVKTISTSHVAAEFMETNLGLGAYDLNLLLENNENTNTISGYLVFNTEQLYDATIDRFIIHYLKLLENVLENPNREIAALYFLTVEEKNTLLYDFNTEETEFPGTKPIHHLFAVQAARTPDVSALVGPGPGEIQLSYRQLNEEANRLAWALIQKGVGPDAIVAIMIGSSLEMITGLLGILKAGGSFLPIDPETPVDRVKTILDDCRASLLLAGPNIIKANDFTDLQGFPHSQVDIHITAPRPPIKNLNSIQIPDRSLVDYEKYGRVIAEAMVKYGIAMQATRGCPYNCAYCCRVWPRTFVTRTAENIFAEMMVYYRMGVRRFAFYDDIFNLDVKNSSRFFNMIIENNLKVQLFFPTGFRGDILSKEYIDLVVRAGAVNIALSLETASPRIQKLIRKNLNLKRFQENVRYICENHPQVILELQIMHGFPSETEEEARMSLDFVKSMKWIDFPYIHILKIHANTDIEKIALENGISKEAIANSRSLAYHELPETLPFDKSFTLKFQSEFLNDYFLSKERLLQVLPYQLKVLTRDEIVQKYNSYLPTEINSFEDLLAVIGISREELGINEFVTEDQVMVPDLNAKMKNHFHPHPGEKEERPSAESLRVLLLDLTQFFSSESHMLFDVLEPPLGLMYLLTHLNRHFGNKVVGKIAKSRIDFNSYADLKALIDEFRPDLIGLRAMTFYKELFHSTTGMLRWWGVKVPIIVGGPYATSDYRTILKDRNIDLVVLGEGEETIREIVVHMIANNKKLPPESTLKEIQGLAYVTRSAGKNTNFARDIIVMDNANRFLSGWSGANPLPNSKVTDLAYTIFTSGSSGQPKGVAVEHRSLVNLCAWHNEYYSVTPSDRATKYAGFGFDASVWEIFPYLIAGASLIIIPDGIKKDINRVKDYFEKYSITIGFLPTQFAQQFIETFAAISGLRVLLTGGDKLNYFSKRHYQLYNNYGPTEDTVVATSFLVETSSDNIPIGKPIKNNRIYILAKNHMSLQPIGVAGEMCISGPGLARGYLNNPVLTAEKFDQALWDKKDDQDKSSALGANFHHSSSDLPRTHHSKLYFTGDLARWLANGNIEYLGRIDQQVKIRGYRLELGEIESHLINHNNIQDAVVIDRQDKDGEKYLCGYIVWASPDVSAPDPIKVIKDYLGQKVPDYMVPAHFVILDKIPLNDNGKVDVKSLPEPGIAVGAEHVSPRNDIEWGLVYILSEVMGIPAEKISVQANIFAIGVNSITLVKIAHRISEEFNTHADISSLFTNSTVEQIVADMQKKLVPAEIKRLVLLTREKAAQNLFIHSGDGSIYIFKELARLLEGHYNVYGILARGIFDKEQLPETRKEIYEDYIREIKVIQPEGPYQLAGHCFGAIISYELVRELEDRGNSLKKLIILDEPALMPAFIMNHFTRFQVLKKLNRLAKKVTGIFKAKPAVVDSASGSVLGLPEEESGILTAGEIRQKKVEKNFRRLFSNLSHFSRIINTPVLLLKANEQKRPDDPRWNPELIRKESRQGVELITVPGDHFSMLKSPQVETLGRLILEKA